MLELGQDLSRFTSVEVSLVPLVVSVSAACWNVPEVATILSWSLWDHEASNCYWQRSVSQQICKSLLLKVLDILILWNYTKNSLIW